MHRGYIKLWRKSFESQVWANIDLWRTWCCCLLLANHEEGWASVDGITTPVKVEPGQFITGRFAFHKAMYPKHKKTNANPLTVWRWLIILDQLGNISLKSNNKYSVITIVNWDIYQGNNVDNVQQVNNNCSADVQQTNTNKNVKNVKNTKEIYKESFGEFKNVRLTPEELEKLKNRFLGYQPLIETVSSWLKSNGKVKKDYYATCLNFARRDPLKFPERAETKLKEFE